MILKNKRKLSYVGGRWHMIQCLISSVSYIELVDFKESQNYKWL